MVMFCNGSVTLSLQFSTLIEKKNSASKLGCYSIEEDGPFHSINRFYKNDLVYNISGLGSN